MWIHEHPNWPKFTWNSETLTSKISDIRHRQGRLLGNMEGFGFELQKEASLCTLTSDVIKSCAIEGEDLDEDEVRSSIARRLGLEIAGLVPTGRNVEGVVEMMLDASQKFATPLTAERLFDWHAALFPTGRSGIHKITVGAWRTSDSGPMQVISGPIGRQKIHFEAPNAELIDHEMQKFFAWFEDSNINNIDPVLKAGIAHFWFITIHPFEDGNGRIARAIGDMALARADGISNRFYSLSTQIESERKDYYNQLEKQQRATLDLTNWLEWFLDCLGRAISNSEKTLGKIIFKGRLWDKINRQSVNERQRIVINRMLENDFKGHINTSKYAKLAKCSNDTALRDIQDLKMRGILIQNPGAGRSTSYSLCPI